MEKYSKHIKAILDLYEVESIEEFNEKMRENFIKQYSDMPKEMLEILYKINNEKAEKKDDNWVEYFAHAKMIKEVLDNK